MNYSVQNLTQIADCDALLSWAQDEKDALDVKRHSEEFEANRFTKTSESLQATYQMVLGDIQSTQAAIDGATTPASLKAANNRMTRLQYKKFLLEDRKESYGVIALLEKQMELARVNQQIAEIDAFVTAVEAQKGTLAA